VGAKKTMTEYFQTDRPMTFGWSKLIVWSAAAIFLGATWAITGIAGIYIATGIAMILTFTAVVSVVPGLITFAALWTLILMPYFWGLTTGTIPKLFADEAVLLLYIVAFPLLHLCGVRSWKSGYSSLYLFLALYLALQAASFAVSEKDLVALRNFLETSALGAILLILFVQESSSKFNQRLVTESIVWIAVIVSIASVAERVYQKNPVLEQYSNSSDPSLTPPIYLSAQVVRLAGGAYRPYVSFFHPSEAGMFMAMCLPFLITRWKERPGMLSFGACFCLAAGLLVNATRGTWVAAALIALMMLRDTWKIVAVLFPISAIGSVVAYWVFRDSPFMERIVDPNNFLARFVYWRLGWEVFANHPLLGVGHMQFAKYYLGYVSELTSSVQIDLNQVNVLDNIYLTSLAEHGLVGFVGLVSLFICLAVLLRNSKRKLLCNEDQNAAAFVRCTEFALLAYVVAGCFADVTLFTKVTKLLFILIGMSIGVSAKWTSRERDTSKSEAIAHEAVSSQLVAGSLAMDRMQDA
jgi:O-antigen ligase